MVKKFIPCIYLYHEHAVKSLSDLSIIETDPMRLVNTYNEKNADELIIFDMSSNDEEHEAALDIMKEICSKAEMDVIGTGNIKRMEDVKKILYTGCKKAILDYSQESNITITEEVSLKFGKDKIYVSADNVEVIKDNLSLIEDYSSALLLMNPHIIKDCEKITSLPYFVQINDIALNKMLEILTSEQIGGITGNFVNANQNEIISLKELCKQNNIKIEQLNPKFTWNELKSNSDGLIPVIVQDYKTNEVLMLAYMNEESYNLTLKTGRMTYYSRSRQSLWLKGETSGHFQYVKSLSADCDFDTILAKVSQVCAACHTGKKSCFFNEIAKKDYEENSNPLIVFEEVFNVIKDRKINPKEGSYTNYLFDKGIDKILKKLGEEATEIVIAAKNPNPNEIKYEISDFLYHCMVLMAEKDVSWEDITTELANR